MEHVVGPSLRAYLTDTPMPSIANVHLIARQLFAAMVYAHEQGVLHRDLKPTNIVLANPKGERTTLQAKILDFGIAKVDSAAALTKVGTVMGTPGYMPPEQYMGESIDARADQFSLAVILYEMLAGSRPFQGSLVQVLQQVMQQDAPLLSRSRPDLPQQLDAVFQRALAKKAIDRYESMRAFREAFIVALAPEVTTQNTYAVIFHPQNSAPAQTEPEAPTVILTPATAATPATPAARPTVPSAPSASLPPLTSRPPVTALARPTLAVPGVALAAMASSLNAGLAAKAGARPRVLFLDDEERILGALSAMFRLSYEVFVCTEGSQALEIVKTKRPHVIVSDQRMPHMLGIDFLRQAREIDASSVRILLTGYSDLAAIVGSINDGEVFRFVNKPWSNQEIKNTISEAIDIALATQEEVQSSAATPPPAQHSEVNRASAAILVADAKREVFEHITQAFGRSYPVCHASTVGTVLETLEDEEVAVLIVDMDSFEGASVMLKMLKQAHPQILTIVITASSDSEALIGLINQAQIFRFLNRPLRDGLLDRSIRSALVTFANYKAKPVLLKRHSVEAKPEVAQTSIGHQIMQRLGFLRKLMPS
jgi:serine/threonine-protein kinase